MNHYQGNSIHSLRQLLGLYMNVMDVNAWTEIKKYEQFRNDQISILLYLFIYFQNCVSCAVLPSILVLK